MAFDGAFIHTMLSELNLAAGARVEKIYQPSYEELLICLKKKDFSEKLLISSRNGSGRIGYTSARFENPQTPPMFCMLARKIFSSARFIGAFQEGLERVLELRFESVNEMGDIINPLIICEFIGGGNNIILADENRKILDAVNRTDITAQRLIMPGCIYIYPESRGKLNLLETDPSDIISAIKKKSGEVSSVLLDTFDGLSPLVCRELCQSAFGRVDVSVESVDLSRLISPLENLKRIIENSPEYTLLYCDGIPKDFSFCEINQYGSAYEKKRFLSASQMLEEFYNERDRAARLKKQSGDIIKTVNNLLSRAKRRMNVRIKDLEATKDRENLRICGELIKANIHLINTGDSFADVQNFYDEDLKPVRVKLDRAKSPAANAAAYFKEYKKKCAASGSLGALIESDKQEIEYLDSVLYGLERANSIAEINDICDEMIAGGYIKSPRKKNKNNAPSQIEEHKSAEGYKILVGHNNVQNDIITTRLADKTDTWFHTKNIHGSHVVVKNGGANISDETLLFAAKLAALNSRAKNSSNVPVDYTLVKYVKKPAGAKAGMVIYTTNKTIYVTPWEG